MYARLRASPTAAPTGAGALDFSAAADSPVRMLSLHSRPLTSMSRTSAGTSSPSSSRITSPGTSSMTSTRSKLPSRRTTAVWWMPECIAAAARSARYSFTKPRPTLTSRMTPMMIACVLSPRKYDSTAVTASSAEHGVGELTAQYRRGAHPVRADARWRRPRRCGRSRRRYSARRLWCRARFSTSSSGELAIVSRLRTAVGSVAVTVPLREGPVARRRRSRAGRTLPRRG